MKLIVQSYIPDMSFPGGADSKESACSAGELGSIPGLGRSPGEGNGYLLQDCGRENSMDCTVHGVAKTQLSDFSPTPSPILNLCGNNSNIKVYHCDVAAAQNKYGKISQKKKSQSISVHM